MSENEETKDMNPDSQEDSQEQPEEKKSVLPEPGKVRLDRRNFIGKMMVGCGAALGLQTAYAGGKFLAEKPVAEKKPVNLSLASLPEGSRTSVMYGGNKVEVIRTEKGVRALSMVCTHLGCIVIWEDSKGTYHCPCHDAYFDENGGVVSGPPTLPLEEIPVTISGNTVIIGG
ncbi:ubiquinol-cytochrome c reductase iron-sulfur subunit [candidate division KSB1 bacterium]